MNFVRPEGIPSSALVTSLGALTHLVHLQLRSLLIRSVIVRLFRPGQTYPALPFELYIDRGDGSICLKDKDDFSSDKVEVGEVPLIWLVKLNSDRHRRLLSDEQSSS